MQVRHGCGGRFLDIGDSSLVVGLPGGFVAILGKETVAHLAVRLLRLRVRGPEELDDCPRCGRRALGSTRCGKCGYPAAGVD